MKIKYSNPYLKDERMRYNMMEYIEKIKPTVVGNKNLNIFDETIKPVDVPYQIATAEWMNLRKNNLSSSLEPS